MPIALVEGANGGTAIEVFTPADEVAQCFAPQAPEACHQDVSTYGRLYDGIIGALGRYRVGAILWDQAEDWEKGHMTHI